MTAIIAAVLFPVFCFGGAQLWGWLRSRPRIEARPLPPVQPSAGNDSGACPDVVAHYARRYATNKPGCSGTFSGMWGRR